MSELQIFNAHPKLYWGTGRTPIMCSSGLRQWRLQMAPPEGITEILGHQIPTTGVLGASGPDLEARGFPRGPPCPVSDGWPWGRRWHFFFAWIFVLNGLGFGLWSLLRGHAARDLWPTANDVRSFRRTVLDHLRFRHPTGEAARHYNVLQKIAYAGVIFGLAPSSSPRGWPCRRPWTPCSRGCPASSAGGSPPAPFTSSPASPSWDSCWAISSWSG